MKIAIVVQDINFMGGAERVAVNLANYLAVSYDVSIVSFLNFDKSSLAFDPSANIHIASLGSKDFRIRRNFFSGLLYRYRNWNLLSEYLLAERIEIVISNNIFPNISTLKRIYSASILEIHHMCYEETYFERLKWARYFRSPAKIWGLLRHQKYIYLRNLIYKRLKYLIVLTKREKEKFNRSGVKNTVVIPNAIDLSDPSSAPILIRRNNMVAAGRFVFQKGYDRLVRIIAPVLKRNHDWTVTIFGSGPDKEKIADLIKSYGVEKSFLLENPTKDIREKLLNSEIYLMTSRYEGFPMILLEALGCGLPIVSFDIHSGPREIISDREDGFLVKDGDEVMFREKVEELISDSELRLKMRQNAYKNIKRFSWNKIGTQWEKLLKSVSDGRFCGKLVN